MILRELLGRGALNAKIIASAHVAVDVKSKLLASLALAMRIATRFAVGIGR
jgi:hypothetical protein